MPRRSVAEPDTVKWTVRVPPDLNAALRSHLANPLLVGLPKGVANDFFISAIRRELAARGVSCSPTASSPKPSTSGAMSSSSF